MVIGGSAGIGLETARLARAEGAEVVITGRNRERLEGAAGEVGRQRTAAFDATDFPRLERFFADLPTPIDHVLVTGPGPYYAPLADSLRRGAQRSQSHILLPLQVARSAVGRVRAGGTLLFMGGTSGRATAPGFALISAPTAAGPAMTRNLALELAPIRVNLIAAGFVDTPLSAALLGDQLDARRGSSARRCPSDASSAQGHRRARRPSHDEHRAHGRDLRHRRRPAARPAQPRRRGRPEGWTVVLDDRLGPAFARLRGTGPSAPAAGRR